MNLASSRVRNIFYDFEKEHSLISNRKNVKYELVVKTRDRSKAIVQLLCTFKKCYVQVDRGRESNLVYSFVEIKDKKYLNRKVNHLMNLQYIDSVEKIVIIKLNKAEEIKIF